MSERYDELADRLDGIAEELRELTYDVLREAAAAGETKSPEEGKRLTKVTRAVEKAASLLRSSERVDDD